MKDLQSNQDPPISTLDIVALTIKQCDKLITSERAYTHEIFKEERDHTTIKLARVVNSHEAIFQALLKRIQVLEAAHVNQDNILNRITDLELISSIF